MEKQDKIEDVTTLHDESELIQDDMILYGTLVSANPCYDCDDENCKMLDQVYTRRKVDCSKFNLYLITLKEFKRLMKNQK